MRVCSRLTAVALLAAVALSGCGSSSSKPSAPGTSASAKGISPNGPEVNPAGDIPDNQAYVLYRPAAGGYTLKVPEGWSRTSGAAAVSFTDKLNRIEIASVAAPVALTTGDARRAEATKLARTVKGFRLKSITRVMRSAGPAIRLDYLATSAADSVTGKTRVDAVERYVFFHNGRDVTLTLSGPKQADNVDPWKIVTNSLRFTR